MKTFSLLVKPASADCNLRCEYCFYLKRCALYPGDSMHRMSDAVLEQMIRTYMATEQRQYVFGWQGGEPTLMGLDFFRRVTSLQKQYGRPGSVVANGLQSNGTLLTAEMTRLFSEYKFLLGISVDGPESIHNRFRVRKDACGSFADVMRGIGLLRQYGVEFNILTLVSRANVANPLDVYRYLRDNGFLFHQYIECVEFDSEQRLQPFAVSGSEWGDFLCAVFDEWHAHDLRNVSVRLFDSILAMMLDGRANVCQMGRDCRQYLVVEHNGDVYPCDFFVEGDLRLGNVMKHGWGRLIESDIFRNFGKAKARWSEACEACEYLRFCGGDCQKNRFRLGPDPRQLSELCEGWKRFYAHALPRLEVLAEQVKKERSEKREK